MTKKVTVKLETLTEKICSGSTPRGGDSVYINSGIALIRSQNVYNGNFSRAGLAFIPESIAEKMVSVSVNEGDVLLNITGDSVARCCIVPSDLLPGRVNQHVMIIRADKDVLSPKFLMYYLTSPLMQKRMLSFAGAGGTRKALTKGMVQNFEIPRVEKPVQEKIVSILSAYDDLIENNRRRIELLEESARLLYQEWFVRLRFPGHETTRIINGIPEGWKSGFLPDSIEINPKEQLKRGGKILYVPMASLSEKGMVAEPSNFELRNKPTSVKFRKNDVLLARITPCLENGKTGFAYFLKKDEVACGSTEFIIMRGIRVSPYFTYCLARSYDFRELAIKSMTGSSGRQRVQTECFKDFFVPIPNQAIQDQFDNLVKKFFSQIQMLMQQNQKLAEARDLLLPRLMSGEIEV